MIRSLASTRASSAASAAVVSSGYPMAIRSAMVAPLVVAGRLSQSNRPARRAPHPSRVSAGHRASRDHGRHLPADAAPSGGADINPPGGVISTPGVAGAG